MATKIETEEQVKANNNVPSNSIVGNNANTRMWSYASKNDSGIDVNKNYMASMQEKEAAGDFTGAAKDEQDRNKKIDITGSPEQKTYKYAGFLDAESAGYNKPNYEKIDTDDAVKSLNDWREKAERQAQESVKFATDKAVLQLEKAKAEADAQYQTQRKRVAAEEKKALDNSALYSSLRGDKGGIGQAQYNSVQNAAAQNLMAINNEQIKLATDTKNQIAQLRAQGEYEKADRLLEISQSYLGQLNSIKQWAANYNLSVDQMNDAVNQWVLNYNRDVANAGLQWGYSLSRDKIADSRYDTEMALDIGWKYGGVTNDYGGLLSTGYFTPEAVDNLEKEGIKNRADTDMNNAYNKAMGLVQMGIMPDDTLLEAAGLGANKAEIQKIITNMNTPTVRSSGGSTGVYSSATIQALLDKQNSGENLTSTERQKLINAGYVMDEDGVYVLPEEMEEDEEISDDELTLDGIAPGPLIKLGLYGVPAAKIFRLVEEGYLVADYDYDGRIIVDWASPKSLVEAKRKGLF